MNIAYAHSPYSNLDILNFMQTGDILSLSILFMAFALGVVHSLEPGHGKTQGLAYLVGSKSSVLNAVLYGIITTVTHIGFVFIIALIILFGSQVFMPNLEAMLQLISGIIIFLTGIWMLSRKGHHHGKSDHKDKGIFTIALSAGIIPCYSSIAILLTAVYFNQILTGIIFLMAFSLGMCLTLIAVATISVKTSGVVFKRLEKYHDLIPKISAGIILIIGLILTLNSFSLFQVG